MENRKSDSESLEELIRDGRQRLYPRLTNPNWLVLRKRREIFEGWVRTLPPQDLLVLDIGGRIQPYRPLLESRLRGYISVDVRATRLVAALARGEQLPFGDDLFDVVICTQMMQYIPEPSLVVNEARRVLKRGGRLFLSVPSAYPIDSEEECWRFLPAGIRQLLTRFSRVHIVPEGRSIAGFFRTVNCCLHIFVKYRVFRSALQYSVYPLMNLAGALLEMISGTSNEQFAVNYSVLAEK
jgi:SAM-dependent methyltransferase